MADLDLHIEGDAVFAFDGEAPVGTASWEIDDTRAHLRSVFVEPAYRGRGVAGALLDATHRYVRRGGARVIDAMYEGPAPALERALAKAGWRWPMPGMLVCRASKAVMRGRWARARPPRDVTLFPWAALSSDAAARVRAGEHPEALSPFTAEPSDDVTSVGARAGPDIVGWLITHRVERDVVRYSRLFVRPERRHGLLGLALVAEAMRRQDAAAIPFATFGVRSDNQTMRRFVERSLATHLDEITDTRFAERDLA